MQSFILNLEILNASKVSRVIKSKNELKNHQKLIITSPQNDIIGKNN